VDTSGNLYVADHFNHKIRKIIQPQKSVPVITWPAPAAITYGTALSAAQLDATASVPGSLVYTPAAGTILNAGVRILRVTFTPTDTTNFTTATAARVLIVRREKPVITWATPAAITHGTALSSSQLNATANVPGAFVYTPAAGTVLNAGVRVLRVTFTPDDGANYTRATAARVLIVRLGRR
jgi:hypothetical protein